MEDEDPGGRGMCIPPFKMPTLNKEMLQAKDSMRDGYCPKMLLYVLDELFYIYVQVKNSQRHSVSPPTAGLTNGMGWRRPACLMPWPC